MPGLPPWVERASHSAGLRFNSGISVEAEQKIAQAQAEAESLHIQKQQVTSELLRLREVENKRRAIEKWDGKLPTTLMGNSVPFVNVGK